MSVYIKGMDMPKRCAECTFETLFSDDMHYCAVEEILTEDYRDYRGCRPPLCPLTEVPKPHGKLIDADKLYAKVQSNESEDAYVRFLLRHSSTVIEAESEAPATEPESDKDSRGECQ